MSKRRAPKQDYTYYLEKVGDRIREVRKSQGFSSYDDFAYEKDISRSQLGRYEKGSDDLRLTSLLNVIRALGMTPKEFFSEGFDSW